MEKTKNKKLVWGISIAAAVILIAVFTAKPILLAKVVAKSGLDKAQLQNKTFGELWDIYKTL